MFTSKLYRATAAIVGVGSCGWYAYNYNHDMKERFGSSLIAASTENTEAFPDVSQHWDDNWDKRKALYLDKDSCKPTATRHYILIRHGQYNLNGSNDSEKKLTSLGREQAKLTGKRLETLLPGLGLNVEEIFESTMTRAKETSGIIQKSLPGVKVSQTDLLREGAPIRPIPSIRKWEPAEHEFFADGARIEAAFRKHFHRACPKQEKDSVEVYVCHANVIRYIACRALQFPPEGWLRMSLHNCSITWITVRPNGRVSLRCLGDAGHLPPDKLTFN